MWWKVAGIMGASAVALGAFGAHGLQQSIDDPHRLEIWNTAAHYQLTHALALCAVASHPGRPTSAGILFTIGVVVFSGSLYILTITGQTQWGAITPIGGVLLLCGWIFLACTALPETTPHA